jgi:hypothetical protein
MSDRKWTKEQRRKFMATMKKQRATIGWGQGRSKKKPYRKPRIINVVRSGNRELLIRIELV